MTGSKLEEVREATVSLLLAVRAEYLAAGASALKHWDQLQDRVRSAARTSSTLPEWSTALGRSLGLGAPSRDRCSAIDALHKLLMEQREENEWLALVESEYGYLLAMARLRAEQRRETKRASKAWESSPEDDDLSRS